MILLFATVGRNDYRIYFWSMNKSQAVNRMINVDDETTMTMKKYVFIIVMPNNISQTMTKQQR